MRLFGKRRKVSFHRTDGEAFRLETGDVEEGAPFWARLLRRRGTRRDGFSRYIAAGGARDLHAPDGQDALTRRSWRRFAAALTALALIWLLGTWL